jgi:hypothetical protein
MNRSTTRWVFGFLLIAVAACVDTAEPTGPVPTPNPDPGEIISTAGQADGALSAPVRPASRSRRSGPGS